MMLLGYTAGVTAVPAEDVPTGIYAVMPNGGARQESFDGQLYATGGIAPLTWSVVSGALPTGLSLGSSTGAISGNVDSGATLGANAFTVRVTDANGDYVDQVLSIDIGTIISLMHFNGSDGGTTFADETGKTWTRVNSITTSTAQQKFGTGSAYPGGASGRRLRLSAVDATEFNFGAQDYTLDMWVYAEAFGNYAGVWGKREGNSDATCTFSAPYYDGSGSGGNNATFQHIHDWYGSSLSAVVGDTRNAWHHLAVCVKSSYGYLFFDGNLIAEGAMTAIGGDAATDMVIGACYDQSDTGYLRGYMQEWRATLGAARWTENFTPPTAPSNYPA